MVASTMDELKTRELLEPLDSLRRTLPSADFSLVRCLIFISVLAHYLYDRACQRAQILRGNDKGWH